MRLKLNNLVVNSESFSNDIKPKWKLDDKSCYLNIATGKPWAYLSFKPKE